MSMIYVSTSQPAAAYGLYLFLFKTWQNFVSSINSNNLYSYDHIRVWIIPGFKDCEYAALTNQIWLEDVALRHIR